MIDISDKVGQCGYQVKAMLQNNVYIFREDSEMVVIPLDEIWGKTVEETKAIIERYFSRD